MAVDIILEKKDGEQFKIPVLPPEMEIAGGTGNQSIETIKQGEVTVFGKRKLRAFSIQSFFTANEEAPYCRTKGTEFKTPTECVKILLEIQESEEPVRFITTGLELNAIWVTLENVSWSYQPGTNDINYQADFKEYRPYGQRIKKYEVTKDVFNLTKETKALEGTGGRREPTSWAIGDNALATGKYYRTEGGPQLEPPVIASRPDKFLMNVWTKAAEETYKQASFKADSLQNKRVVIIDIIKTQTVAGIEVKSAAGYCIADANTKSRIGWVAESQLKRV